MKTSLQEEVEAQRRWVLRPTVRDNPIPTRLLDREFLDPEEQRRRAVAQVRHIVHFAMARVPHYASLRERLGLTEADLRERDVLERLPVLTKEDVHADGGLSFRARGMPKGEQIVMMTRSSGTTGQPTEILHSTSSRTPFTWLKQRELRWFRWDPTRTWASIRPGAELPPKHVDGDRRPTYMAEGDVYEAPHWPRVGRFFHTGPSYAIVHLNPLADQVSFLRRYDPAYVLMQSAGLEHLALAHGHRPNPGLQGVQAVSQTLTPAMEDAIARTFGVGVQINYGFNEIGLIASRCSAGRYHVHAEHVHVEILDDDDQPTRPGQQGRLVATGLNNYAMPLIRYDSGDLAEAVDGPCPCGRTLPSFGPVLGRYRRLAFLPEGTWTRWGALQMAMHRLPAGLQGLVERYQAHEFRDGHWTLRLQLTDPSRVDDLAAFLRPCFEAALPGPAPHLEVLASDAFEQATARKFQDFLSDFQPEADDTSPRR